MHLEHKLPFDLILGCPEAFGIFHHEIPVGILVDEIGYVSASMFNEITCPVTLSGDKHIGDLLT